MAGILAAVPATPGTASLTGARRTEPQPTPPRILVRQVGVARPGGYARIEVTYENVGGAGVSSVDFGDGSPVLESEGHDQGCGGVYPGTASETLTHAYRRPGNWTVTVSFAPKCAEVRLPPTFSGQGTVTVQPGRAPSNGPVRPMSDDPPLTCRKASSSSPGDRVPSRTVACFPEYGDADGYVTKVVLRWGDGLNESIFTFRLSKCVDPANHWPETRVDDDGPVWGARHRYANRGTFRVTATVTSSGCDGRDTQVRTAAVKTTVD